MSEMCTDGTEREITQPYQDEQYEECGVCGGYVDLFRGDYYKSTNDETFRHILCHEDGEPPEGYVFEMTDTDKCCTNRQYNCGHLIYAPQTMQPRLCPECNDHEWDGKKWSVRTDTNQTSDSVRGSDEVDDDR